MIPTKLILSNFTSYGEAPQELNFGQFHLAAISGPNGAGKSSLLDAITWCIWGFSRAGDSSDQLVRLGATQMQVEVSFLLDEHQFTVKRRRLTKSGGSSSLEFFAGNSNLTEGTIKATQQKIINTLHLSFETFTNSAFIRQGHADEFTLKGPADRKRILADILGLSHYDALEEKAKEKSRQLQTKLQLLEYQLLEIEAELSQKEEREKAVSEAKLEADQAEKELAEVEKLVKELELRKEVISTKLQALEEKANRLQLIKKELSEISLQIELKEKTKQQHLSLLSRQVEIEAGCSKLKKLQDQKLELDKKRSQLIALKDALANLQKIILELEDRRSKKITNLEVEIKKLETQNQALQTEIDHLKTHKDNCPTCGQTIGAEKNKQLLEKNQQRLKDNNLQLQALKKSLDDCKKFVLPQQKQAGEKEAEIKQLEAQTQDWNQLNQEINELLNYEDLNTKLQQAQTLITSQQEAVESLKQLSQAREKQIQQEEQDLAALEAFQAQLQEIEKELAGKAGVKSQLSQKSQLARSRVGAAQQLQEKTKQLEELARTKQQEKSQLQKDKGVFDELALAFGKKGIQAMIIETAIPEIEEETNQLLDKLTAGRMRVLLQTQKETKTKLADGEKGTIETLDIVISDEMGERPYENYSGGEQFRINFAIRLALSRLLTNRAGSKLQFLVIDEGFGTQDVEGRTRIVEALDVISHDFAKILVITHLDELKEEFPVRIEVLKGPTGSTFEVVGV